MALSIGYLGSGQRQIERDRRPTRFTSLISFDSSRRTIIRKQSEPIHEPKGIPALFGRYFHSILFKHRLLDSVFFDQASERRFCARPS
jgi:hypothetical protein